MIYGGGIVRLLSGETAARGGSPAEQRLLGQVGVVEDDEVGRLDLVGHGRPMRSAAVVR